MAKAGERREKLVEYYREASTCTRCRLAENRTRVVFGAGNADADLMFLGEGPGAEEDKQGLPFVGRAGQLLNKLLEEVGLSRDAVWISNTVRCRPPGNRDPQLDEIEACGRYTDAQIQLIEPKVICTLGNFATKLITGSQTGITRVRGEPQDHVVGGREVKVFPLLHPAAALRTPKMLELLREDIGKLPALLDPPSGASASPRSVGAPAAPGREAEEAADQLGMFGGGTDG